MFKKFNYKEDVSGQSKVKSSVQRSVRSKLLAQYPKIEPVLEELFPKKSELVVVKCREHISLFTINNEILFFQHFDGPYYPTLKVLHAYPDILPKVQVDRGAVKFVMQGAQIMCPGLTSKGARLDESLPAETIVAVMVEGKENALGVGLTKMSTNDIKTINKGVGVDNIHYLADPLWKTAIEA